MIKEGFDSRFLAVIVVGIIRNEAHKTTCKRSTNVIVSLAHLMYFARLRCLILLMYGMSRSYFYVPGPPNTLISSDELPPLSLIGIT